MTTIKQPRTHREVVLMTPERRDKLIAAAQAKGISRGEYINRLLDKVLK